MLVGFRRTFASIVLGVLVSSCGPGEDASSNSRDTDSVVPQATSRSTAPAPTLAGSPLANDGNPAESMLIAFSDNREAYEVGVQPRWTIPSEVRQCVSQYSPKNYEHQAEKSWYSTGTERIAGWNSVYTFDTPQEARTAVELLANVPRCYGDAIPELVTLKSYSEPVFTDGSTDGLTSAFWLEEVVGGVRTYFVTFSFGSVTSAIVLHGEKSLGGAEMSKFVIRSAQEISTALRP